MLVRTRRPSVTVLRLGLLDYIVGATYEVRERVHEVALVVHGPWLGDEDTLVLDAAGVEIGRVVIDWSPGRLGRRVIRHGLPRTATTLPRCPRHEAVEVGVGQ